MSDTVATEHLRAFIERLERLHGERKDLADDIRQVYAEAKGVGFDTKALKTVLRLRAIDAAQRQEEQAMVDLYMAALGMQQ